MYHSELQQSIDASIAFPITRERLLQQLGDVELTAPTGDSVRLTEVLRRTDESEYHSTEMLCNTIAGNLDDAFIGRKYYDDRSGTLTPESRRSAQQSL